MANVAGSKEFVYFLRSYWVVKDTIVNFIILDSSNKKDNINNKNNKTFIRKIRQKIFQIKNWIVKIAMKSMRKLKLYR